MRCIRRTARLMIIAFGPGPLIRGRARIICHVRMRQRVETKVGNTSSITAAPFS